MEGKRITLRQAAVRLGCTPQAVNRLVHREVLDARKLDPAGETSALLVSVASIEAYEDLMARTVGTREASKRLGVPLHRVYAAIQAGTLPAQKVGGRWRVNASYLPGWKPPEPKRAGPRDVPPEKFVKAARAWVRSGQHSAKDVAKALGVDESTVSRWVSGERRAKG